MERGFISQISLNLARYHFSVYRVINQNTVEIGDQNISKMLKILKTS